MPYWLKTLPSGSQRLVTRIVNVSLVSADQPLVVGNILVTMSLLIGEAGIDNPEAEARLLFSHALGWPLEKVWRNPEEPVCSSDQERVVEILKRRLAHEPFAYIRGKQEFWSLDYLVGHGCLIPRSDSECLIETALDILQPGIVEASVLDAGTGSGCLLLSLLSERSLLWGVGIDISAEALRYAKHNACMLSLLDRAFFVRSDWASCLDFEFDLVICNPPYIESSEVPALMPEVSQYEPAIALNGGRDGLGCYRLLAGHLRKLLAADGRVCMEIGFGQASSVIKIMCDSGFRQRGEKKDLSGIVRCLVFSF